MRKPIAIALIAIAVVLAIPALPFLLLGIVVYPHAKQPSTNPWFWW